PKPGEMFDRLPGEIEVLDVDAADARGIAARADNDGGMPPRIRLEILQLLCKRIEVQKAVALDAHIFAEAKEDQIDVLLIALAADALEDLAVVVVGDGGGAVDHQADAALAALVFPVRVAVMDEGALALRALEHA